MTFASMLLERRNHKGWTQTILAKRSGVSVSYIHRLESGARQPGREAATALAGTLDCPQLLSCAGYCVSSDPVIWRLEHVFGDPLVTEAFKEHLRAQIALSLSLG